VWELLTRIPALWRKLRQAIDPLAVTMPSRDLGVRTGTMLVGRQHFGRNEAHSVAANESDPAS